MANPFTTRATEHVKLNEAFLGLVTPDPITCFLQPASSDDGLLQRLILIQGPPGSGKTTIARLFEFSTLATLMQSADGETHSELVGPLTKCGAIANGMIRIIGCRLPLESDYQELWQLPYTENVRGELLLRLIQARAILAWFSQLSRSGITPSDITLQARDDSHAPLKYIGGETGIGVLERAKEVESAVYRIVGALLPPSADELSSHLVEPYEPFNIIEAFRLSPGMAQLSFTAEQLRPLLILDDAHYLHQPQLATVKTWLMRRELKLGRWILSRLDVLQPQELFESLSETGAEITMPGVTAGRDVIRINLQSANRKESRKIFRDMARQMSQKYLRQMRIFEQNDIHDLERILPDRVDSLSPSVVEKLVQSVRSTARRAKVSDTRLTEFQKMAEEFLAGREIKAEDIKWAIVRILIHRYVKRTPQTSLFADDEDLEPNKPLRVDLAVMDGALIQLFHEYERPHFIGFETLADAASENAETFLQLAAKIVETSENLLIKQRSCIIPPREQQRLLTERVHKIVEEWSFPEHRRVRAVCEWIAERCLARTLEGNAPLGHGANAYGIPGDEFKSLGSEYPALAQILKFAVAYNALTLVPNYDCKNKPWCLLELGGVFIVKKGLPFKRGGFIEGTAADLTQAIKE